MSNESADFQAIEITIGQILAGGLNDLDAEPLLKKASKEHKVPLGVLRKTLSQQRREHRQAQQERKRQQSQAEQEAKAQQRQAEKEAKAAEDKKRFDSQDMNPDAVVELLNQRHAVITYANRVLILSTRYDPQLNREELAFLSPSDLRLRYANRKVMVPAGEEFKIVSWGNFWIEHPARREFEGLVFMPKGAPDGYYNIWRGFAFEPKAGDCRLFMAHLLNIICSGDQGKFMYLWRWLAHLVQRPEELPEVAIVLRGKEGTGKNTLVDAIGAIVGRHYVALSQMGQLSGRFTGHLMDALLVFANEAVWGGDKQGEGALKSMITDPLASVEAKGKDAITVPNFKRIIAASNSDWVVPRGIHDRRYFCLDVSDAQMQNSDYFGPIKAELANGGHEAILYELLHEDITGWHPRASMPANTDGEDMKINSMSTPLQFWADCLYLGQNIEEPGGTDAWCIKPTIGELYDFYLTYCRRHSVRHPAGATTFGHELRKAVKLNVARPREHNSRNRVYQLPELEQARQQFREKIANIDFSV